MYEDLYFTKPTGEKVNLSQIVNWLLEIQEKAQYEGLNKVTDYTPGSQAYHAVHQQALIMFNQLERINESEYNILPFHMKGEYLDYWGNSIGVHREGAKNSTGVVGISLEHPAEEDIIIHEGSKLSTTDAITFKTTEDTIILKNTTKIYVNVVCTVSGAVGNVNPNTITEMITAYNHDFIVNNEIAFSTGADEEDDNSYHERILSSPNNHPPGSKGWYEMVANMVSNVQDSYCISRPLDQTATVEIVFNCKDKDKLSETNAELNTLFGQDKYNIAGINLILTPATEIEVFIDNTIQILIKENYTFEAIKNEAVTVVTNYFKTRKLGQKYDTEGIKFLLNNIEGVNNVTISDPEVEECSIYEVFTTDYSLLNDRIVEMEI